MNQAEMVKKYNLLSLPQDENKSHPYRYGRTDYLLTREMPTLLNKYELSKQILDYGCGAGLSTRFLKSLGLDVIGVDISLPMLSLARENDPTGRYIHIAANGLLPFSEASFRVIVSTFVLFAIPTMNEMIETFRRIHRVLSHKGVFIAVTGSTHLYQRDWVSLEVKQFPENNHPRSGDVCKIKLKGLDLILDDYYWTDEDYTHVAKLSGFKIITRSYPLGMPTDGIAWKDERHFPPYVFYEFQKVSN